MGLDKKDISDLEGLRSQLFLLSIMLSPFPSQAHGGAN